MRAVVQRVREASVTVGGDTVGAIGDGLLVYVGVAPDDVETDAAYLADKIRHLRIFPDEHDRLNRDVGEVGGKVLAISAFTVQADARRGRRPAFDGAARPEDARVWYDQLCDILAQSGIPVERGSFGDYMDVRSVNAGPVCVLLDSRRQF